MAKSRSLGGLIFLLIVIGLGVAAFLNRQWLVDYWRGHDYVPTNEMGKIEEKLNLTERGEFLFKASRPELEESEKFNENCRSGSEEEIAVLGCYTEKNIYIYNITDTELDGIRELTTAHELLHAVWARMSASERKELDLVLTKAFEENQELLGSELDTYPDSQKQEELYVRAGTEVKKLPELLEAHYGEIFKDQDKIVDFYEKYIAVFREIEARMTTLKAEMDEIGIVIDAKTEEYKQRSEQLAADAVSFNACADTEGCFQTEADFYGRRAELVAEQEALNMMYEELNALIEGYNIKVNEYNENVIKNQELNQKINSNTRPEGLQQD